MNLLITGGMGGIGWETVLAAGALLDVRVVTIGRSAAPDGRVIPSHVTHEVGSIQDAAFLERVMREHEITHLIHAAGARTQASEADPRLAIEANVLGTDVTFRAARAAGTIERAVHFSSAAIYGKQDDVISEEQPISPTSNYAITKAASELAVRGHTGGASFQTAIVRPAFVMGTRSAGKLTDFVRQAVSKSHAELSGPGPFHLHWAADLAASVLRLLRLPLADPVEVFHAPGIDTSLTEFLREVQEAAEKHGKQPTLTIQVDPDARFPARLSFDKLNQRAKPIQPTALSTMIREIMDGVLSRELSEFT